MGTVDIEDAVDVIPINYRTISVCRLDVKIFQNVQIPRRGVVLVSPTTVQKVGAIGHIDRVRSRGACRAFASRWTSGGVGIGSDNRFTKGTKAIARADHIRG